MEDKIDIYDLKPGTLFQIGDALAVRTINITMNPPNGFAHVGGVNGKTGSGGYWPVYQRGQFYASKVFHSSRSDQLFRLITPND